MQNLRWLAEGNPKYAGTSEEGQQNMVVAHLMADDFLLTYVETGKLPNSSTGCAKGIDRARN